MRMNKILTTIILLLSVLPSVGTAQIFGPSNYEDCIIEGMQGVASDVAAVEIRRACDKKFPDRPVRQPENYDGTCEFYYDPSISRVVQLTPDELSALDKASTTITSFPRNGTSTEQYNSAAEAVVQADKDNSPSLELMKSIFLSVIKRVYYEKSIPGKFIRTLDIPFCSKN